MPSRQLTAAVWVTTRVWPGPQLMPRSWNIPKAPGAGPAGPFRWEGGSDATGTRCVSAGSLRGDVTAPAREGGRGAPGYSAAGAWVSHSLGFPPAARGHPVVRPGDDGAGRWAGFLAPRSHFPWDRPSRLCGLRPLWSRTGRVGLLGKEDHAVRPTCYPSVACVAPAGTLASVA